MAAWATVPADEVGHALELAPDIEDTRFLLNTPSGAEEDTGPLRPGVPYQVPFQVVPANTPADVTLPVRVRQIAIFNGTGATIYRSYAGEATPGAWPIPAGGALSEDVSTDRVSLYCTAASFINGPISGGIIVEAYT